MPSFVINDKCDGCKAQDRTACQYICPNDLMVLDKEKNKAFNRAVDMCWECYSCVKICPTQAIQADWDMLVAMAPDNYAHYRKALDEAAARGEYRWLMDPDSIDFDDPLYKQREREIEGK